MGIELKDLIGEYILDAVDFSRGSVRVWGDEYEDFNIMRFRLDGVVYVAAEDPNDGYRSAMRDVSVGNGNMSNIFPPCKVVARHRKEGQCGYEDDVLELIDANNGKLVVEVGTEHVDDYYPCFVASFRPEAMEINKE